LKAWLGRVRAFRQFRLHSLSAAYVLRIVIVLKGYNNFGGKFRKSYLVGVAIGFSVNGTVQCGRNNRYLYLDVAELVMHAGHASKVLFVSRV
jgi:hypothetical protein